MLEWQLKKPGADTAKLAAERGSLEYDIGNHLYYLDGYDHRFSLLYHWLLACEHLDAANEMHETALAHRKKAEVLMDLGIGSSLAVEELERAIELDPSDSRAYYKLGNAYRQNRRSQDAIPVYLK
jgi:tetratricopeptide (TPR) repeat protein